MTRVRDTYPVPPALLWVPGAQLVTTLTLTLALGVL
jgi:hypothetical protein